MANKNKKSGLTGSDILIAVLTALAGGVGLFLVILVGGLLLFPDSWQQQTAAAPSAQATQWGTLPSTSPTSTPAQTQTPAPTEPPEEPSNEPEETEEPVQQTAEPTAAPTQAPNQNQAPASTPAPTRTPTAPTTPTQNPAPAVSIQPVQNTAAPTQAGNAGTTQNSDGTYTHDFSGGRVLATTESNNNNDPVYHTRDCRSAKRILPENELWYSSAQAAQNDGRRLCGNCGR